MFFLEAIVDNASEIGLLLEELRLTTCLQINQLNSKVYLSTHMPNNEDILQKLGMVEGQLLVKYLGIPLSTNYVNAVQFTRL